MIYFPESNIRVKSYDHSNLSRASVVQFRASRYIMYQFRTSVWKVLTIRISRELPFFNFERLDILCPKIGQWCEKLWPFKFLKSFGFKFRSSRYIMPQIEHPCEKLWPFEFLKSFCYSISSVFIYYVPESDFCVKSYDQSNFSRASVVQFRVSWWVMSPNRTFVWKLITIWISREVSLFNFERLDLLCPRIRHLREKL